MIFFLLFLKNVLSLAVLRAAVLERMPVIEKNSGQSNGESAGAKTEPKIMVKPGETSPPQQPVNQVTSLLTSFNLFQFELQTWIHQVFPQTWFGIEGVVLCVCVVIQVCDLLDLLGGSEGPAQPNPAQSTTAAGLTMNTSSAAGGDLLDLLGGFQPSPPAPGLICKHTTVRFAK